MTSRFYHNTGSLDAGHPAHPRPVGCDGSCCLLVLLKIGPQERDQVRRPSSSPSHSKDRIARHIFSHHELRGGDLLDGIELCRDHAQLPGKCHAIRFHSTHWFPQDGPGSWQIDDHDQTECNRHLKSKPMFHHMPQVIYCKERRYLNLCFFRRGRRARILTCVLAWALASAVPDGLGSSPSTQSGTG